MESYEDKLLGEHSALVSLSVHCVSDSQLALDHGNCTTDGNIRSPTSQLEASCKMHHGHQGLMVVTTYVSRISARVSDSVNVMQLTPTSCSGGQFSLLSAP